MIHERIFTNNVKMIYTTVESCIVHLSLLRKFDKNCEKTKHEIQQKLWFDQLCSQAI
jgi:predicted secreted Zn-dependent protease